ncbi:hypothetical protein GUITHDRAFT_82201 [Guillardia theta CCMP2712]|uniref:SAM-dependent MTase RsmB/NOP-type domain-containing protein n=1 Tax=Guillardia theta (strain CCMP2712) TaxID=905079 RepID=L1I8G4_GUITC|nr:hypothetical protein GUITHDRAFT_82201 [Guillardia theta CCMP2712]EKX32561.1 hypothetical protein GUITHDRAFT_82201 [Guillardia theta CCMP2712]|eukprot:XP_005819541.1 hypothetical protein GUITHDRAFT_82201 [Guillardia theta CCMP2712]
MGKRQRGGKGGRGGRGGGRGGRGGKRQKREGFDDRNSWPELEKQNKSMEDYYKVQNIVPESEWEDFLKACRDTLPTTFRISPVCTFADEIREQLKSRFTDLHVEDVEMDEDDERLQPPKLIPWYPQELAWQMSISKKAIKRTAVLERFHKYLIAETETGNLTRQEAVSMIPPLLMDVKPHHRVLDMCAAPGSKTSQLLEFVHAQCGANGVPKGIVIANDADLDRCSMLIHQMKRINSPSLLVMNHEAQKIPMLWAKSEDGKKVPLRYDRVLADVPCTGDGTMRKNVDVWRKWTPAQAMGLHKTQLQICTRAVELCEAGGIVVYSTCSMNPIENEAVVSAVLKRFKNCLELEDVSHELPELKRRPGLLTWKVKDRKEENKWSSTPFYFSYNLEDVPPNLKSVFPESMFPPADAADLHLERCMRVLPHDQNTGAFFICKLRKTADHMAPSKQKEVESVSVSEDTSEREVDCEALL